MMTTTYKPNDIVFVRMNDYSVQKGCVYCVIEKTYSDRVEYSYEVQYSKSKIAVFPQREVFSVMEDAFI
jgi:hypothetical protein